MAAEQTTTQIHPAKFVYLNLLWRNLGVHPLRSAFSAAAIGLQVFLILLIVGLTSGILSDWRTRAEGVGADVIVQPPNSSIFFSFSSAVIPQSQVARIEKLPGIDEVAPVVIVVDTATLSVIYGIDYARFTGLSEGFTFLSGGAFTGPNDVIADDLAAQARRLTVGSNVSLMNRNFRVSGIVVHGKGARFFVPMETAQEIAGAEKRVSMIYARSTGNTEAVRAALTRLLPGYRVRSMAEYMSLMTSSSLPELRPFLRSFIGLGVVISFLVVLLTMYTMVLERRREIGILKAIGSSRLEICWLIVAEALLLVALGVVVGLLGTYGATALLHRISPTLQIEITADWIFRSILVAVVGALAGAAYPAVRAARSDPINALAYE
ncbi:MAG: ABC transporter permease [Acidobacteria bacterium]|nr:MAG: ABC transporter permease [Acidobacteriota bacterium]